MIMDTYEKKYKEALERAKAIYQGSYKPDTAATIAETLQYIFPELAESEDERIRKALVRFHKSSIDIDGIKGEDILAWLEKQGEQKVSYTTLAETGNGGINALVTKELPTNGCDDGQKPTDNVEPKFKVKYAGSEYNVFETKDIAGVTFYGIEDEPNHIDYVKADNCEIISGYGIKEIGLSIPTKPVMFSEQKPSWSEEDARICRAIICDIANDKSICKFEISKSICDEQINWLKSLKQRIGG